MADRLINRNQQNLVPEDPSSEELTVFHGTVVQLQTAENCFYMTVMIPKPRIQPLTEEQERNPKLAETFNRQVKAADEFMADLGLGAVEVRYLNIE